MLTTTSPTPRYRGSRPRPNFLPNTTQLSDLSTQLIPFSVAPKAGSDDKVAELAPSNSSNALDHKRLPPEHYARLIVYREDLDREMDAKALIDKGVLPAHHSVKRIIIINGVSFVFTAGGMLLYFATAGATGKLELFQTTWSNSAQNQYFTYGSVSDAYDEGITTEFFKRLAFGVGFAIPNGVATLLTATNASFLGLSISPLAQGIIAGIGNVPLNLFARDQLMNTLNEVEEFFRLKFSCSKEVEYLRKIKKLQNHAYRSLGAFVDSISEPEDLDLLFFQRNISFAEQMRKILNGRTVPVPLPENSEIFDGIVFVFKIGGGVSLIYSTTPYGFLVKSIMIGSIIFSELGGHFSATPLYTLSAAAGAKVGVIPELPWLIKKFITNANYRNHAWPSLVALAVAGGTSFKSYGTSEDLARQFGPSEMTENPISLWIIRVPTSGFNTLYSFLPNASTIRTARRWVKSWCDPVGAERDNKYEQLMGRLNQLLHMSVERFIDEIKYLRNDPETLLKFFGNSKQSVDEVLQLIDELEFMRRFKRVEKPIQQVFEAASPDQKRDAQSIKALTRGLLGVLPDKSKSSDAKKDSSGAAASIISVDSKDESGKKASVVTSDPKGYVKIEDVTDEDEVDAFLNPRSKSRWCCASK